MIDIAYYLIQPKAVFLDLLQSYQNLLPFFRGSVLWQHEEGGYGAPLEKEWLLTMKLLYLAQFRSHLLGLEISNKQQLLDHMMGTPPFTEDIFNRWWTIERIAGCDEFQNAIYRINDDEFDLLATTGMDHVDYLIKKAREWSRQEKNK